MHIKQAIIIGLFVLLPFFLCARFNPVEVKASDGYKVHNLNTGLNYTTIQGAINALETLDGHMVFVDNGVYYENVLVNKRLSLVGESEASTVIDGNQAGSVLNITANDVLISTFTIRNSSKDWPCSGIYITNCSRAIIQNNSITDNLGFGIFLDGTDLYGGNNDNTINSNGIANNFFGGIRISGSNNNSITLNTIEDNGPNNQWAGIYLVNSAYDTVEFNKLTNNWCGIRLVECWNSTITSNDIRANLYGGIYLEAAMNNSIYHNSLIDNTPQVFSYFGYVNTWDNGHPSGGNYWSDYTGVDANYDCIGDSPYVIDVNNQDRFPLMGPFSTFVAGTWNEITYNVDVVSNSTISDFAFNADQKLISFNVTGLDGTVGFCRATVPNDLLGGPYVILLNDSPPLTLNQMSNGTHTFLYFTYNHSIHTVQIIGTEVVPEFPSTIILPLLMALTMLAIIFSERRIRRKHKT